MGYCLQDRKFCTFEQWCARWAEQSGGTARKQQNKTKVPGQCDVLRKPLMPTDSPGRGQHALCLQAACRTLQPTNTTDTYLYIQPDYCSDLQHFSFCFLVLFCFFPPGQIITETAALLDTSQVGQQGIRCKYQARIHPLSHFHVGPLGPALCGQHCLFRRRMQELHDKHTNPGIRDFLMLCDQTPIHYLSAMALLFFSMASSPL